MGYVELPEGYDFTTQFPTYVIAFCPDVDCWFVTNQRFFYFEYDKEFETEQDGIEYFKQNPSIFYDLELEMGFPRPHFYAGGVWLDNTHELIPLENKTIIS